MKLLISSRHLWIIRSMQEMHQALVPVVSLAAVLRVGTLSLSPRQRLLTRALHSILQISQSIARYHIDWKQKFVPISCEKLYWLFGDNQLQSNWLSGSQRHAVENNGKELSARDSSRWWGERERGEGGGREGERERGREWRPLALFTRR